MEKIGNLCVGGKLNGTLATTLPEGYKIVALLLSMPKTDPGMRLAYYIPEQWSAASFFNYFHLRLK